MDSSLRFRLPGYLATGLLILTTSLWTFWGTAEMYYEGWGMPFPKPLAYLIPAAVCLALTLASLTWPRFGGWLLIVIGGGFTLWWWRLAAAREWLGWRWILSTFPVSGMLILTGALFLLEGRHRQRRRAEGWSPPAGWFRRNARYVLAVGFPLLTAVAVSAYYLPTLLTRVDDGDRGARLIEGQGEALVWAPEGPGWNWKQPWGGYPSWNQIALYGVPPVGLGDKPSRQGADATEEDLRTAGLCRYLSEDGRTLMAEPQNVWRMPTADEVIRSLVRHGANAGCTWDGQSGRADCRVTPDKETPLWAPDQQPIYYWTADEYDAHRAYYVSYNGGVGHQPKSWGNPRHGYRCVREP